MSYWYRFRKFASLLTGLLIMPFPASALQYGRVPVEPGVVDITVQGPIVPGDFDRLSAMLPKAERIRALVIDSPGGSIVEASKIAALVSQLNTPVFIPSGSQCSSACFLIFAAAQNRLMAPDALLGVHSVSDSGREDLSTMGFTTLFAREAATYGVPPAVIGKIVQTEPGRIAWLTPTDLNAMSVVVVDTRPPNTSAPRVSAPASQFRPQPSFSCAKARLDTEKAICQSPLLINLDFQLAGIYAIALQGSKSADIRKQQRQWLRERNACGPDNTCIEKHYRERISTLQFSPEFQPPGSLSSPSFSCTKARTKTEIAICRSSTLSRLDVQLSALYAATKQSRSAKYHTKKQRAWLRLRNACGSNHSCLERRYREQIAAIQSAVM